jgi:broad specificity phosphatase PhoE
MGRRQAEALGAFLAPCPITRVVASPLSRARETAEHVARLHGLQVEPVDALAECDVGHWEGKTNRQVEREDPEAWQAFLVDPALNGFPGGETFGQVRDRVAPALEELLTAPGGTVTAAVAHNLANRAYLAHVLGIPIRLAGRVPQYNGAVNLITRSAGETRLVMLNCLCHLETSLWQPDYFPFPRYGE